MPSTAGMAVSMRVVLVVVLVHPVAADQEEVLEAVDEASDLVEALVGAEVRRVSLGHAHDMASSTS